MAESKGPGPGRATADTAFNELKKEIARRNEKAQVAARKTRTEREVKQVAKRRKLDSL